MYSVKEVVQILKDLIGKSSVNKQKVHTYIYQQKLLATKNELGNYIITESDLKKFIYEHYSFTHILDREKLKNLGIITNHFTLKEVAQKLGQLEGKPSLSYNKIYHYIKKKGLKASKNELGYYIVLETDLKEFIETTNKYNHAQYKLETSEKEIVESVTLAFI